MEKSKRAAYHKRLAHEVLAALRPIVHLAVLTEAQQQRVYHHLDGDSAQLILSHFKYNYV